MRKSRMLAAVVIAVLFFAVGGCTTRSPLEKLLDETIKEYGGRANLEKLDSWTEVWDMQAKARGEAGTDTRNIELPDKLRVTLDYGTSSETRVINGNTGFHSSSGGGFAPARGPALMAMKSQLMRCYTPLTLLERKKDLKLSDVGEFKVISLKDGEVTANYWIDPKTKRIVRYIGTFPIMGTVMQFRIEYSDFSYVQGVLLPHGEDKFAGRVNTATLTLRDVRFNEKFPPGTFLGQGK